MKTLRWWAAVVALAVGLAYAISGVRDVAERLSTAERDRAALAQQVRSLGGVPVAGPKGDDGTDGRDGRPGPTGPAGPTGSVESPITRSTLPAGQLAR